MAPSKYSFATVLATIENDKRQDDEVDEWNLLPSLGAEARTQESGSLMHDEFYLDPQPQGPTVDVPPRQSSAKKPDPSHELRATKKLGREPPPVATTATARGPSSSVLRKSSFTDGDRAAAPRAVDSSIKSKYHEDSDDGLSGVKKRPAEISLAEFLNDLPPPPNTHDLADRPRSSRSSRAPAARSQRSESIRSQRADSVRSHSRGPPSQLPSVPLSFGIKKKVNLTLDQFLAEGPEDTKSTRSPLSPIFSSRPETAKTSTSSVKSPKLSLFKSFSSFSAYSKRRQESRQNTRKDSSSASSFRARTVSDRQSVDTSRTSWDSPRESRECVLQAQTQPSSQPHFIQEPLVFDDSLIIDPEASISRAVVPEARFDTRVVQPDEFDYFPNFDTQPEIDLATETEAEAEIAKTSSKTTEDSEDTESEGPRTSSDIDSYNPQTPTDVESHGNETPAGTRTPTKSEFQEDHDASDTDSFVSTSASIITPVDLSAAPPNLRTMSPTGGDDLEDYTMSQQNRESLDSVAPPPITLLRSEKEPASPKSPKFPSHKFPSSKKPGRINLLKRATSKPDLKPKPNVTKAIDPEHEKQERMAELELLTKSVPYERATRGMQPFTNKEIANSFPQRKALQQTSNSGRGVGLDRTKKRDIGIGLREERILMGALEQSHWKEKERRARLAAEAEYRRVMREGINGYGPWEGHSRSRGLTTIQEF